MPHIQKLFFTLNISTSILEGPDGDFPAPSGLCLGLALLHKRQLKIVSPDGKGNLSFLVSNGQISDGELTIFLQKLRQLCYNSPFCGVWFALPWCKLIGGRSFPNSRMSELLRDFSFFRG